MFESAVRAQAVQAQILNLFQGAQNFALGVQKLKALEEWHNEQARLAARRLSLMEDIHRLEKQKWEQEKAKLELQMKTAQEELEATRLSGQLFFSLMPDLLSAFQGRQIASPEVLGSLQQKIDEFLHAQKAGGDVEMAVRGRLAEYILKMGEATVQMEEAEKAKWFDFLKGLMGKTTALTLAERQQLEQAIGNRLGGFSLQVLTKEEQQAARTMRNTIEMLKSSEVLQRMELTQQLQKELEGLLASGRFDADRTIGARAKLLGLQEALKKQQLDTQTKERILETLVKTQQELDKISAKYGIQRVLQKAILYSVGVGDLATTPFQSVAEKNITINRALNLAQSLFESMKLNYAGDLEKDLLQIAQALSKQQEIPADIKKRLADLVQTYTKAGEKEKAEAVKAILGAFAEEYGRAK